MRSRKSNSSYKRDDVVFTPYNIFVGLYILAMTAMFCYQAWLSIDKFLESEIVEEVSEDGSLTAVVPPMSLCMLPAIKKPLGIREAQDFANYCPKETKNFTECFWNISFHAEDVVDGSFWFPSADLTLVPPVENADLWVQESVSLMLGKCITYYSAEEAEFSMSAATYHMLRSEGTELSEGWMINLFVHNPNMLIPSIGMSSGFSGQIYKPVDPSPGLVSAAIVDVTRKINLNREDRPCVEEADYNPVRCMEQWVAEAVGCKMPTDKFKNDSFPECQTFEQWSGVFKMHQFVYSAGAPQIQAKTGCLPPCTFYDYQMEMRTYAASIVMQGIGGENVTGVGISLRSTNIKTVKEVYFYKWYNLVGEVGGCLGMFLGVSLISLFHMFINIGKAASRYII